MNPIPCAHKGCKNTHKSSSGYCVEHAHEMERHTIAEPKEGRTGWPPMLAEEFAQ